MKKFPCIVGAADFPLENRGRAKEGYSELFLTLAIKDFVLNGLDILTNVSFFKKE